MVIELYNKDMKVRLTNFGARLTNIFAPDKDGNLVDVIQGFDTEEDYLKSKSQGAICGPVANRIANAQFTIDGKVVHVEKNHGKHSLHSGEKGYRTKYWSIIEHDEYKATFSYTTDDGENGFPGRLVLYVSYELTANNKLVISFSAETDKPTPVNITSHPYFNLKGEGNGLITDHNIQIFGDSILELNDEAIPTGKLLEVKNTPFDFLESTNIGNQMNMDNKQIKIAEGYDHSWVIDDFTKGVLKLDAIVEEPESGRVLKVYSKYPTIQFYTSNTLDIIGKGGKEYKPYSAFCLEPQFHVNAVNEDNFPDIILRPEEEYNNIIIYEFTTM